jgi:hypothetical protein
MQESRPPDSTSIPNQEWAAAIASGAPPFHRFEHPAFYTRKTTDGAKAARLWADTLCRHEPAFHAKVPTFLGLGDQVLEEAFGDAALAAYEPLPAWASWLVKAIQQMPTQPIPHAATEDSINVAARSCLGAARTLLKWDQLASKYKFLDDRALDCFAWQLATRIVMACGAILELESLGRSEFHWDFSQAAWLQRLCGFTGLNYVVGTATRQWRQNALELLRRLSLDLPEIRERLFAGAKLGPLTHIEFDLGDRHNDGRSVALLTFHSGARVVYKPKDARCAETFFSIVDTLNTVAGESNLPRYRVLSHVGYSWDEYVQEHAATTLTETHRVFKRFGMVLRLLQLLEGRDFWIDNLRMQRDMPVFVDFECILQPRIDGVGFEVSLAELDPSLYQESVLPTGAVTHPIDVPGFGRQDFGALSSAGTRVLPLGMWTGYRDRDNGNVSLRDGRLYWSPDVAWPQPDGRLADARDFLADIEAGYRRSQELLARSASMLLSSDGPLEGLDNLAVRVLMRSTWEYLVLLRASLEPSSLLSGVARELMLANVLGSAPDWGDRGNIVHRMAVARSEMDSLRELDIPEFFSTPSSTMIRDVSGRSLADIFSGTAEQRFRTRLATIESFDTNAHAQILRVGVASIGALRD